MGLGGGNLSLADLVAMCCVDSGADFVGNVDAFRPGSLRTAEALMTRRRLLAQTIGEGVEFPGLGSSFGFGGRVRHCSRSGVRYCSGIEVRHHSRSCECRSHIEESEEGGELHF